jgi:hypothetical protein
MRYPAPQIFNMLLNVKTKARGAPELRGAFSKLIVRATVHLYSGNAFEDIWREDFYKKRVLIVGTGPSLDHFPEACFKDYDSIVGINFGAKIAQEKTERPYFFSTDINGLNSATRNIQGFKKAFRKERTIFAPCFVGGGALDFTRNARRVTIIRAKSYSSKSWFELAHPPAPTELDVENWLDGSEVLNNFPVFAHTSALSAILFSAFYRPEKIDMIGCDFSKGRSAQLKNLDPDTLTGRFEAAAAWISAFKTILNQRGVELDNLSMFYGNT